METEPSNNQSEPSNDQSEPYAEPIEEEDDKEEGMEATGEEDPVNSMEHDNKEEVMSHCINILLILLSY